MLIMHLGEKLERLKILEIKRYGSINKLLNTFEENFSLDFCLFQFYSLAQKSERLPYFIL